MFSKTRIEPLPLEEVFIWYHKSILFVKRNRDQTHENCFLCSRPRVLGLAVTHPWQPSCVYQSSIGRQHPLNGEHHNCLNREGIWRIASLLVRISTVRSLENFTVLWYFSTLMTGCLGPSAHGAVHCPMK